MPVRAEAEQQEVERDAGQRRVELVGGFGRRRFPRIRWIAAGAEPSESSSVSLASRKFERSSSGGTQRSSPHQSVTRLQSGSSSAARR